jgi:hypothetical protein
MHATSSGRSTAQVRSRKPASLVTDLTRAVVAAVKAILRNADKTVFPAILLVIVALFLVVQDRIDRSDPKLALAPLFPDPDLDFPPPSSID